ncbi:MAG: TetR/AcrR family transcriptional regulator [Eubacteriales bacterium]|nr:TetR/AcrR family transcriptional regulator [Eubacteriales bacterium]
MFEHFEKTTEENRRRIVKEGIRAFSQGAYAEVSTDGITQACGISKGLLFHYFGSKKSFYEYCLRKALERLLPAEPLPVGEDFYGILFTSMDESIRLCQRFPDETHFTNMCARDSCADAVEVRRRVFDGYARQKKARSMEILQLAASRLSLKNPEDDLAIEGLYLYVSAIVSKYLIAYQERPDDFLHNAKAIQRELRQYLDCYLYGILKQEEQRQ